MQTLVGFFLITLPWLNPFTPGPSPAVMPWLVSLAATAGLIFLASLRRLTETPEDRGDVAQRWASALAWALVFAGLLSSGMALLQYFGAAHALSPWVNQAQPGEAFANLRQRNQLASLTNMALVALLWLARGHGLPRCARNDEKLNRCPALMWLAAGLLSAANAATVSRTGLVQLVLLLGLSWLWGGWRQPRLRGVLISSALVYLLASQWLLPWVGGLGATAGQGALPGEIHGALARLRDGDALCGSRLTLWANVLHLIAQKPWLGWGWGELAYAHFITLYDSPRFCDILGNAHNLPLHLAVTLGVPAALLLCGAALGLVLRARPWREVDPTRQMAWGVLGVMGLHSLLEFPLWFGPFLMAAGLCVLLLYLTRLSLATVHAVSVIPRLPKTRKPFDGLRANGMRVLSLALITVVAYAAWDYDRISQIYLPPERRASAYREHTLEKISASWLFRQQVRFAELTTTPLTLDNAAHLNALAHDLLHYSPEARVVEKLIASAQLLGRTQEALYFEKRLRAAYP